MLKIPHERSFGFLALLLVAASLSGCGVSSGSTSPSTSSPLVKGQLTISPSSLGFGSVNIGSSHSLNATLAAGKTSVTVYSVACTGAGFSVSGVSFPLTIPAGKSASFTVEFTPQAAGNAVGAISFLTNLSSVTNLPIAPTSLYGPVIGTEFATMQVSGSAGQQAAVLLNWSPESSVQGYYVFRSGQTGGPYSQISGLQPTASYTDGTVTPGQTYYYVVTSLSTSSMESGYSQQVQAVVPAK